MITVSEEENSNVCIVMGKKSTIKVKLLGNKEITYILINEKQKLQVISFEEKTLKDKKTIQKYIVSKKWILLFFFFKKI